MLQHMHIPFFYVNADVQSGHLVQLFIYYMFVYQCSR